MSRAFHIVPGSAGSRWLLGGLGAYCLAMSVVLARELPTAMAASLASLAGAGLLFYVTWSTRNVQCVLSPEALRIRGDMFGRTIRRSDLRASEARLLSLDTDTAYQPFLRTFGTGAPGYLAGWFRLRNREKALVFVTDRTRVVYLPTTQGYTLLLSLAEPQEFLEALRG